jgi:hypothetical protein
MAVCDWCGEEFDPDDDDCIEDEYERCCADCKEPNG